MYRHYVQFVPKGVPPRDAGEIRAVDFSSDTLNRDKVVEQAVEVAESQKGMDPYAMRNHWEVFQVEAEFDNPPWSGFVELCETLCRFDYAKDWKSVDEQVYVSVQDNKESELISQIKSYYAPLNPRVDMNGIVVVDSTPVLH